MSTYVEEGCRLWIRFYLALFNVSLVCVFSRLVLAESGRRADFWRSYGLVEHTPSFCVWSASSIHHYPLQRFVGLSWFGGIRGRCRLQVVAKEAMSEVMVEPSLSLSHSLSHTRTTLTSIWHWFVLISILSQTLTFLVSEFGMVIWSRFVHDGFSISRGWRGAGCGGFSFAVRFCYCCR